VRGEIRLTAQKTHRQITIPLGTALASHIASLGVGPIGPSPIHPRAFQSVQASGGKTSGLSLQFARLLVEAGLRTKLVSETNLGPIGSNSRTSNALSFHSLRHTAVSLLKDAGIPQATVQEMIGHETKEMSQAYTHVGRESLLKAANSLPSI
jgi:integrase